MLLLASGATCEPTQHAVGPYVVSADAERYINWTTLDPMVLELAGYNQTVYTLKVTVYSLDGIVYDAPLGENHINLAFMKLDSTTADTLRTPENLTVAMINGMATQLWAPISISPRVFDGYQGMLGVAYWNLLGQTLYMGQWIMNDTYCTIVSNIEWGKGTRQIFDTIHVEEVHD